MKIVKIIGGLGNQMFQFAFFLGLKEKGIEVKLDISDYKNYQIHNLELNHVFNILNNQDLATESEINTFKDRSSFIKIKKIIGILFFNDANRFIKKTHWIEPKYSHFYKDIENSDYNYLEGYWQNENYFVIRKNRIRKLFDWSLIDKRNEDLALKMSQEESVAIHIRRFNPPHNFKQILFTLKLRFAWRLASKSYYLRAIRYINSQINQPQYYIFTDNISWFKKNISLSTNINLIDWNKGGNSNLDMYLMTRCKHNIISMSSFSWWGAWLNNNPDKIVIAPKKWAPRFSSKDEIIPKKWIRL